MCKYKFTATLLFLSTLLASSTVAQSSPSLELVSVDSYENKRNYTSISPAISAHGRYVVFASNADLRVGLVPVVDDPVFQIYLRDRHTGTTELISVSPTGEQADSLSFYPVISKNGRYVAFQSNASNLDHLVSSSRFDYNIFVRDRLLGVTKRVSVSSTGEVANTTSWGPSISGDGSKITFTTTADNLDDTGVDRDSSNDIYLHNLSSGVTRLISVDSSGTNQQGYSEDASISTDGNYIVFTSTSVMDPTDKDNKADVYLRDLKVGTTMLVSTTSDGSGKGLYGSAGSGRATISADGCVIAYASLNPYDKVFAYDCMSGSTELMNVTPSGSVANGASGNPMISPDGRYVSFDSSATNLSTRDQVADTDVYVRDRQKRSPLLRSVNLQGVKGNGEVLESGLSDQGRYVVYSSDSNNLLPTEDNDDRYDVYVHEF